MYYSLIFRSPWMRFPRESLSHCQEPIKPSLDHEQTNSHDESINFENFFFLRDDQNMITKELLMFVVELFEITLNVNLENLLLILKLYFVVFGQQTHALLLSYHITSQATHRIFLVQWGSQHNGSGHFQWLLKPHDSSVETSHLPRGLNLGGDGSGWTHNPPRLASPSWRQQSHAGHVGSVMWASHFQWLCNNLRHNTCAYGSSTFTNGKTHTIFNCYRLNQFDNHFNTIAWHYH